MTIKDVLGHTKRNNVSDALGTRFRDFHSPYGIDGLVRVEGDDVTFLAVLCKGKKGTGRFKRMMHALRQAARSITFLHVDNARLAEHLGRNGFIARKVNYLGEMVPGYQSGETAADIYEKMKPFGVKS